ncbi:MAG: anaerobic ribonucleoside-triphosphate reductase activating protein [Candidatus Moranbacteria bacterium]|jgi:pyruvate formate lyase activating enzyme|nr:anaerobic ribonucleoside-triphosphate reductase activating protein [Candidatus Moranbacteria bacterium]MDD5652471.1 anaerobic ribonucleoside-triphosphate reductase activating protein [Candidatus Moranbacteria bacterium]MDX9855975.1 anaerobic ribonucleoside-triphosphate reductase activating protein [Candidatus Moranbacteria bacterium]
MNIASFQKFTMVDYPGYVAATVFTVGCNFRCPFCHNPELVLGSQFSVHSSGNEREFFRFLGTREGKLDGVCITGGEPTLQPDIIEFMIKIKSLGFLVKLDTNGTRPDIIKKALDMKVVDYIAMDIKNSLKKYERTVGAKIDLERIKLSADLIRNSRIDYDFRTTVVPGFHSEKDFDDIVSWLGGSKRYFLQRFRDFKTLDPGLKEKIRGKKELDLEKIAKKLKKHFGEVGIRG